MLERLVISATRQSKRLREVPHTITVVTQENLKKHVVWNAGSGSPYAVGNRANGNRLCRIGYDRAAPQSRIQETAAVWGVSLVAVKREAATLTDQFAPNVTRETCQKTLQQAKQLSILSNYCPPVHTDAVALWKLSGADKMIQKLESNGSYGAKSMEL